MAEAEYIDRNLIEWYGCDFEDASCENRECSSCSHAECFQPQIMQIPTADVVEREKIDKAIEEIEEYLLEEEVNGIHEQGIMFALEIFEENGICKRNIGES
jgi:hypothetical protein